jgi:hypothetical protein
MSTEQHNPSNPDIHGMVYPSTMEQAGTRTPHGEICDWLRALGLNPAHLPADPHASMVDGQLTLLRKVRGPKGGDLLTPDGAEVMTETITVPVTVPPPTIAEIWAAPTCPTCGR